MASLGGLELLTEADSKSVLAALGQQPDETVAVLLLFLAFTPYVGPGEAPAGFDVPCDWKDAESSDGSHHHEE